MIYQKWNETFFGGNSKIGKNIQPCLAQNLPPHGRSEKTALANPPGGSNKIDGNIYQHDGETIEWNCPSTKKH